MKVALIRMGLNGIEIPILNFEARRVDFLGGGAITIVVEEPTELEELETYIIDNKYATPYLIRLRTQPFNNKHESGYYLKLVAGQYDHGDCILRCT